MNSVHTAICRFRASLKMMSFFAAVGTMAVMAIVTIADSSGNAHGVGTVYLAGTTTQTTPPATPGVASAAPTLKPTTFAGGDWPGMGSFGEDWAK